MIWLKSVAGSGSDEFKTLSICPMHFYFFISKLFVSPEKKYFPIYDCILENIDIKSLKQNKSQPNLFRQNTLNTKTSRK